MLSKEITKHQVLAGLRGSITCTNRSPLIRIHVLGTFCTLVSKSNTIYSLLQLEETLGHITSLYCFNLLLPLVGLPFTLPSITSCKSPSYCLRIKTYKSFAHCSCQIPPPALRCPAKHHCHSSSDGNCYCCSWIHTGLFITTRYRRWKTVLLFLRCPVHSCCGQ